MRSASAASSGKWLPNWTPGRAVCVDAEEAAVLDRDVHLGVERLVLRRAAVEEQQDDRALSHRAMHRRPMARMREQSGNVRPNMPKASDLQELAAARAVALGLRSDEIVTGRTRWTFL